MKKCYKIVVVLMCSSHKSAVPLVTFSCRQEYKHSVRILNYVAGEHAADCATKTDVLRDQNQTLQRSHGNEVEDRNLWSYKHNYGAGNFFSEHEMNVNGSASKGNNQQN